MDDSTQRHLLIKVGDVLRFHPDAAVTRRATDLFLLRRAVNINAALKRMRVRNRGTIVKYGGSRGMGPVPATRCG